MDSDYNEYPFEERNGARPRNLGRFMPPPAALSPAIGGLGLVVGSFVAFGLGAAFFAALTGFLGWATGVLHERYLRPRMADVLAAAAGRTPSTGHQWPSEQPSIVCPRCGRRSFHPEDVRQRYCGACHMFHDDMS